MKLFHFLIALFILSSSLLAEEQESITKNLFSSPAKSLFVSYEGIPSKVYVGQIFPIKFKALIANKDFDEITIQAQDSTNVEIINPNSKWESTEDNTYVNTFYFKVTSSSAVIPPLTISLLRNKEPIESQTLTLQKINSIQLKKDAFFSNVIADSLSVNKYKTTVFDDKSNITVLEIEAVNSNLKDFALSTIPKNGIDSFSENAASQKIYYYAIIPNYQKVFEFTYFDLPSNKFVKISLPMVAENDEVSTQIGLNPKESIFEFYKTVAYGILASVFFILLIRRRRIFYLILGIVFLILFFLDKNPLNHAQLKANSNVMILPTERSTVFFTNAKAIPIEKLGDRDDYIKILLPDGKIGWTQNENIIKN